MERELSAGFAAAVGHARTAAFGRSATSTQDERKGKGNTRTGIEFGCRNGGSSGNQELGQKEFGMI